MNTGDTRASMITQWLWGDGEIRQSIIRVTPDEGYWHNQFWGDGELRQSTIRVTPDGRNCHNHLWGDGELRQSIIRFTPDRFAAFMREPLFMGRTCSLHLRMFINLFGVVGPIL